MSNNEHQFRAPSSPSDRPSGTNSDSAYPPVEPANPVTTSPKPSPQQQATAPPTGHPTGPAATPASAVVRRIGSRRRLEIADHLTDGDRAILEHLNTYRFLDTIHLQHLLRLESAAGVRDDSDARATRRQLLKLRRDGLVRAVAERRVGGFTGGADATIWQLTSAGEAVRTGNRPKGSTVPPSTRFLAHTLAIADAAVAVQQASRQLGGTTQLQIERAAGRTMPTPGGGSRTLEPDLYAVIAAEDSGGPFQDRWFIEVDTGSESLPTLVKKCEQYETYRRLGIEDSDGFPLVLWVFHGPHRLHRAEELQRRIRRSSHLPSELFRFTNPEHLTDELTGGAS